MDLYLTTRNFKDSYSEVSETNHKLLASNSANMELCVAFLYPDIFLDLFLFGKLCKLN